MRALRALLRPLECDKQCYGLLLLTLDGYSHRRTLNKICPFSNICSKGTFFVNCLFLDN